MQRVIATPLRERRQRQHAGDEPDDLVRALGPGKGTVTAVVHDDERPHEQQGRHREQEHGQPPGVLEAPEHQREADNERDERVQHLPGGASGVTGPEGGRPFLNGTRARGGGLGGFVRHPRRVARTGSNRKAWTPYAAPPSAVSPYITDSANTFRLFL